MCKVLNVSRASFYHYFYYSKSISISNKKQILFSRILSIFFNSKKTYGAPRITAVLTKEGFIISSKTVGKYMRILDLLPVSSAHFPVKKNKMSEDEKRRIINLIKDIDVSKPNQVWTTDITYIYTKDDGWVYLSSIIDLFSRKVIAWNVNYRMTKELVIETLIDAYNVRHNPIDVIIHSDKGSQYRSHAYRKLIVDHNCLYSYTSLHHSCDENANQESFHATIKKEWLYNYKFNNIFEVRRACFEYIEGFYNNNRIHSSLGYETPNDFEFMFSNNMPPAFSV